MASPYDMFTRSHLFSSTLQGGREGRESVLGGGGAVQQCNVLHCAVLAG